MKEKDFHDLIHYYATYHGKKLSLTRAVPKQPVFYSKYGRCLKKIIAMVI